MANLFYGSRKGELRLLWLGARREQAMLVALTLVSVAVSSMALVLSLIHI